MIASLGLGALLLSILLIYFTLMYIMIVFTIILDIVRSPDLSGGKKALWAVGLLVLPVITMIAYLITRGDGIGKRGAELAKQEQQAAETYIRGVVGGGAVATELEKAKLLLDNGVINDEEYARMKARLLA